MSERRYKKLARGGRFLRSRFSAVSLWIGDDHLLQVERDHYTESYKRFYFKDIQSITIRRDNRRTRYNMFLGAFLTIFLVAAAIATDPVVRTSWLIFAAVFVPPIIYNSVRGPTCVTHVATAVQNEQAPSLRRLRKAEKVSARIREQIAAAQGLLSPEDVRARLIPPLPESPPQEQAPV